MAALGDAVAQADVGARMARGGDAAPVDRQRLRQPAGDVDVSVAYGRTPTGETRTAAGAPRAAMSSAEAAAMASGAGRTPREAALA